MSTMPSEINHPSSDLDEEVLIKVDNVSKKFCRDFKKSLWYGVKDTISDICRLDSKSEQQFDSQSHHSKSNKGESGSSLHTSHPGLPPLREAEFWANQNISFEVRRGECRGLIGHNGAGKTTLLKMLNGLIKPDTGSIEMHGKVGALIALGAGFNPILTGRENIYVNGSILGLSKKEIDAKLDDIIDFAEVEKAIDAPVRTYSSGMQVRLGFAVAAVLTKPDILILDEVLAVGDASFQAKCVNKIKELISGGTAAVLVSHQAQLLMRHCHTGTVLEQGKVIIQAPIHEALEKYKQTLGTRGVDENSVYGGRINIRSEITSASLKINGKSPEAIKELALDSPIIVSLDYMLDDRLTKKKIVDIELVIADSEGVISSTRDTKVNIEAGENSAQFALPGLPLTPGVVAFGISVWSSGSRRLMALVRSGDIRLTGGRDLHNMGRLSLETTVNHVHEINQK
jgi:lipopolysaccharide transport system ATP-binding protein